MGIGVVLIFYAIALTIAAAISAVVLGVVSYLMTKHSGTKWKRAVLASIVFPFVCVAFAGGWFVVYSVVNYEVFHRDPMLGDTWETPLPNGYALMMIDTTDQGTVYNPKTQSGDGSVVGREDAVFGVRLLQVSDGLVFGARDSGYFGRIGQESKFIDSYFELDTLKNKQVEFNSLEELQRRAAGEGVTLKLREFQSVFADYRTTWFDYSAGAILLLVPMIGFIGLARWIWKQRAQPTEDGS
ncbi:MAG TPA: hypothetical protein VL495_01000 [Edaphobacter sp.]|jgi:hypothetical protein|nr:hypothetical protein [Edaphobacter sp.]